MASSLRGKKRMDKHIVVKKVNKSTSKKGESGSALIPGPSPYPGGREKTRSL
jgi:hypothetical protein